METATLLAGFAFECYNQPSLAWEAAPDGTRTGMLSPAFLREYYDGVLAVDAVRAELFRPPGLLPMQPLETFLVLQVSGGGQPVRCEAVRGTEPKWDSSRFLYVRGAQDATLSVSLFYEVPGQAEPQLLGRVAVAVSELKSAKLWGERRPLSGGNGGRVELKAQYVPFPEQAGGEPPLLGLPGLAAEIAGGGGSIAAVTEQLGEAWSARRARKAVESTTGISGGGSARRGSRLAVQGRELSKPSTWFEAEAPRGPRGAAGVDWSDLGRALGGAASAGDAFEAVCFVENTGTNTQCGIWRQAESRTLVLAFRGTQQDTIADIITDLSFLQQPATLKAHEAPAAVTPAEVLQVAARLEDALAESLACVRCGDLKQAVASAAEVESLRVALEDALRSQDNRDPADTAAASAQRALQGPDYGAGAAGPGRPMVHSGFYTALKSILPRCLDLIEMLTTEHGAAGSWTVYVTGHSLGGALATLMSWEIEALRELQLPAVGRVAMYNFGSPRVGNTAFSQSYNALIGEAFRVVNGEDIVGRIPSPTLPGGDWRQVGRTILISKDGAAGNDGALWIQARGEPVEACPLAQDAVPLPGDAATDDDGRKGPTKMGLLRSALLGQGVGDHMEDAYHGAMAAAIEAWKERQALYSQGSAALPEEGLPAVAGDPEVGKIVQEELAAALAAGHSGTAAPDASETVDRIQERVRTAAGDGGSQGPVDEASIAGAVRQELRRRLTIGEWDLQDLSLLLRVALTLGANLTPAASLMPVRVLLTVYATVLQAELGDRLLAELQLAVAQRISQGVADTVRGWTGKDGYEFGDLTRAAVAKATGKEEYEFGDLSRAAVRSISKRFFRGDGV